MPNCSRFLPAVVAFAGALTSCAPDLKTDPPATGNRPDFSTTTGVIPLPSDILKNPATGKLVIPEAPTDSALTKEVKASIDKLDGWLSASTVTIPFDQKLDLATLTYDNVLLYDVTHAGDSPPVVTKLTSDDYWILFDVGRTPATAPPYNLSVKRKSTGLGSLPTDFTPGGKYAVIVTDAVRAEGGAAFLDNPVFYFLRSTKPLAVNGHSVTVLPDANALALEPARALYDTAFKGIATTGFDRSHALAFTVFSVESGARAVYNPTIVGVQSKPAPLDGAASVKAPLDTKPTISFDQPLDATTLAAGTHLFSNVNGALTEVPVTVGASTTPDADKLYQVTITPTAALTASTPYLVIMTEAIKGTNGTPTEALSFFSLVRNKNTLLDTSTTPAGLNSPYIDNTLDVLIAFNPGLDPQQATQDKWDSAYGLLVSNLESLEALRAQYSPLFDLAENAPNGGYPRLSITALWQFTTGN